MAFIAVAIAACVAAAPRVATAQACCTAGSAVTPARLELHENALVGVQLRAADVVGSFNDGEGYVPSPAGASEADFEEDLFGAVRFAGRAQAALLVPAIQTRRQVPGLSEVGGGLGDIKLTGRYDFVLAGQSLYVPGIALLAGVTVPTGTSPESGKKPLNTDATGIGAFEGTVGLDLEQIYGSWFFVVTTLLSERTARSVQGVDERLGAALSLSGAAAYAFDNGVALALGATRTIEASATRGDGTLVPSSARRGTVVTLAGLVPVNDAWRLQATLFANPPISSLGRNQPATLGFSAVVLHTLL